jgi:hypothetical protein
MSEPLPYSHRPISVSYYRSAEDVALDHMGWSFFGQNSIPSEVENVLEFVAQPSTFIPVIDVLAEEYGFALNIPTQAQAMEAERSNVLPFVAQPFRRPTRQFSKVVIKGLSPRPVFDLTNRMAA